MRTATLDPNYGDESEYAYVFDVDGLQDDGYTITSIDVSGRDYESTGKGEGVITVDAGVSEVSISIEVEAKKKLSGKESATLTLTGGKGTTGESLEKGVSIKDDGCAPGDPQELTGEAACPDKDDPTKAVFAWTATLDPNYGDESEYAYVFDVDGLQDDGYTITSIDVSGRDYESTGKGEGVITVDAGVSEVSISIEVEAKKKLSGKESATLTLTGGKGTTGESLEKGVSIKDDGCAPGDPQELTGEAACPDKDDPTKAVFAWTATLDPNYGDESEYAYVFDVDGLQDDGYTITSIDVSGRDYESTGKGEGVITVDAGVSEVSISIEVEAKKKLSGKESATLTLTGGKGTTGESLEKGVSIKDDGCAPGDPQELTGEAACPDKDDPTKAVFAWTATLIRNYGDESEYAYVFDVDGLQDDGYTITSIDVSGRDYESTGKGEGVITVDAGVSEVSISIEVEAKKKLSGKESATLTLTGGKGTKVKVWRRAYRLRMMVVRLEIRRS